MRNTCPGLLPLRRKRYPPVLESYGHRLGTVACAQLLEDGSHVVLHRLLRDHQLPRYLLATPSRCHKAQDLCLTGRQGAGDQYCWSGPLSQKLLEPPQKMQGQPGVLEHRLVDRPLPFTDPSHHRGEPLGAQVTGAAGSRSYAKGQKGARLVLPLHHGHHAAPGSAPAKLDSLLHLHVGRRGHSYQDDPGLPLLDLWQRLVQAAGLSRGHKPGRPLQGAPQVPTAGGLRLNEEEADGIRHGTPPPYAAVEGACMSRC